jgi:hypothetical protein
MRFSSFVLALVLAIFLTFPTYALTEVNSTKVNHYNIILVIDASGSLTQKGTPTDPTGLRYDAMKLFLGLMTNSGNNVGAIVFNDSMLVDTGLNPIDGQASKLRLVKQIQTAGAHGDTDIGTALLKAVNELSGKTKENGLPSVVLLLTDGNTDLPKATSEQLSKSYSNADAAVQQAASEGIQVYGIWLNAAKNGNVKEIQDITTGTGGYYQEVKSASDLTAAFAKFYSTINNSEMIPGADIYLDANGQAKSTFKVPMRGVDEINIIVENGGVTNASLTQPDGSVLSGSAMTDITISTKTYQMIKIAKPQGGTWMISLKGSPKSPVRINMLYNSTISAELKRSSNADSYMIGATEAFDCTLSDSSGYMFTADDYGSMTAKLHVHNTVTGEDQDISMVPGTAGFSADLAMKTEGTYTVSAKVTYGDLVISTSEITINVGNQPPKSDGAIYKTIKTGLFQPKLHTIDLSDYFTDPEGGALSYSLLHCPFGSEVLGLDGSKITITPAKDMNSMNFAVVATDPKGATASENVYLTIKNVTGITIGGTVLGLALLLAAALLVRKIKHNNSCSLSIMGYSFDSDGMQSEPHTCYGFHDRLSMTDFNFDDCGLDPSAFWLQATKDRGTCELRSKMPFCVNGITAKVDRYPISSNTTADVRSDENSETGFRLSATSDNY